MVCEKIFSRLACSGVKYFWIIFSLNIFLSLLNATAKNSKKKSRFKIIVAFHERTGYVGTLIEISTYSHHIRPQFSQT